MTSDFVRVVVAAVAIASLGFETAAPALAQAPGPAPAPVSVKLPVSTQAPPLASGPASAAEADYTIGIDDILHVIVWDNKELEQDVVVRPDGKISYPLAGEIYVQGMTVPKLTETLKERLSASVKNPNVSVMVKEIRSFRVYFVGKIARAGVYPIKAGTPLLQALTLAGGTAEGADLPAAYIIRGGQKIPVDLRRLIQDGDLSKNLKLETEDTIVVP